MQLIHFSKHFPDADAGELIRLAQITGAEGYDLAVRPGCAIGPENVEELPALVEELRSADLAVPMITAPADLLSPKDDRAIRYVKSMAKARVPLMKLGYFLFDLSHDYWKFVDDIRREMEGWQRLAQEHDVTICYHTHSAHLDRYFMGENAASLAHLIHGFDPQYIGGYLDTGHLLKCGEEFPFAVAMMADQLKIVSLKECHAVKRRVVPAGEGHVKWEEVFALLKNINFQGPLSVHTEFASPEGTDELSKMKDEFTFFKRWRESA